MDMTESNEKLVPLNVKIRCSQKEEMKKLHLNFSAFTRAAIAQQLEGKKNA